MNHFLRGLLILVWVVARVSAADTVEIKQRWVAGKEYVVSMQSSQQSTIDLGFQKLEQTMTMTMDMSVAVRAHEDGKRKRLTMKYDRMAMEVTANGQKLGYDSAKPNEGTDPLELGKALGPVIGNELKLLTNDKDEITEVENYDEYVKEFGALGAPAGMDLGKMFSRDGLRDAMKQGALQAYPSGPVSAGDTWPFSNTIAMAGAGSVTVKGTYTFKGMVEHGGARCAEIQTDATIVMELAVGGGDAAAAGLAALNMKLTQGTLKGPVWFDPQLGMTRDSDVVQEMTMSMKNPGDGSELVVPMKQSIRTTLTKVADLK